MVKPLAATCLIGLTALTLAQQGYWTPVATAPSDSLETAVLMTDGSVICKSYSDYHHYFKLVPDSHFSYQFGTWSQLPDAINGVLYGPTEVMRDGRLFIAGGEYLSSGSDHNTAQIYSPFTNSWTACPDGLFGAIGDTGSSILSDGRILCSTWNNSGTQIYNPATNTWTATNPMPQNTGDEESWSLLPDGSVLNVYQAGLRFLPTQNAWIYTAPLPVQLVDHAGEIGPLVYLYDGRAMVFGGNMGTGATAIYSPPSSLLAKDDSWTVGPVLPNSFGCADVPACVEINGKVLFIASANLFGAPTFFEFDPTDNSINAIDAPDTQGAPDYAFRMLALPNGQVLVTGFGSQAWLYNPIGAPQPSWKAHLTSLAERTDGTFTLTGTQLNGLTNGASYGDESTPNTNYPIVVIKNTATGACYYATSFNHTNMLYATGSKLVQTTFSVPPNIPAGAYSVFTSASGVQSDNSLPIRIGLITMPAVTSEIATPGGAVSYSLPAIDYYQTRTVYGQIARGPSWVSWNGQTMTISPPVGTPSGNYPVLLTASDNATPPLTATSSLLIRVNPASIQSASFALPTVASGATDQLTVTLSSPAPHGGSTIRFGKVVGPISVPATLTIPEGSLSASVLVTAGAVTAPALGQVSVTYGSQTFTALVRVTRSVG